MKTPFKTICVIGLGYIGLPTAATFASRGIDVLGVDINEQAVETINQGKIHIVEPELDAIVKTTVSSGKLKAALKPAKSDAFMVAVPTPFKENHIPDLSYIESAAKAIAPYLKKGNLVVLESTSPVGTTEKLAAILAQERPDLTFPGANTSEADVMIAYCPERVLPGRVMTELIENDRIIGGLTQQSAERARTLYRTFVRGACLITNARTAEMAKLTENSFRDVNIAFANELSLISEKLDINVWELIELANRHPRVNILNPGPGVGGHCIAVDPWFIVDSAPDEARMIRTAREVNDFKPGYVVNKVIEKADRFKSPIIACLGLAFKPNIDDLRESPAMQIVQNLADKKAGKLLVVEPHINELPDSLSNYEEIILTDIDEAIKKADIVLVLVNHTTFSETVVNPPQDKIVIDTSGIWR